MNLYNGFVIFFKFYHFSEKISTDLIVTIDGASPNLVLLRECTADSSKTMTYASRTDQMNLKKNIVHTLKEIY